MAVLPDGERGASAGPSEPISRASDAQLLRAEWERLREEHVALQQATNGYRQAHERDLVALRSHIQRIRNHQARLSAWAELMEGFHARHGPLWLERP